MGNRRNKTKIPLIKDNFYTALALSLLFLTQVVPEVPKSLGGIYSLAMIVGTISSLAFMLMLWIRYFKNK